MLVTRIAPTPSGYLHPGNLVNAVLTWWLARAAEGRLLLRIDDFDVARVREAYLDDVFRTVDWLGIEVDDGPSGPAEFHATWSMAHRTADFRAACRRLRSSPDADVFVCRCSRRALGAGGRCVSGCAELDADLVPGESVLRLRVADSHHPGGPPPGDHVLWRRDDLPAYHLGSLVADEALGVTAVVRGADLRAASALQRHLAARLPAPGFAAAELLHHELLLGSDGDKLSKSAGSQAHPLEHTGRLRDQVLAAARSLGAPIGIQPA